MFEADGGDPPARDNPRIPAAYTYLAQFVDHDITFDPTPQHERQKDPDKLTNFRTPALDLDSVYGKGPLQEPHLYSRRPAAEGEFLLGPGADVEVEVDGSTEAVRGDDFVLFKLTPTTEDDLPRNWQGHALIGDPRNDENVIVSQLHVTFLKFHNAVLNDVKSHGVLGARAFAEARRQVHWHYQWLVLKDLLPRLVGEAAAHELTHDHEHGADELRRRLRFYQPRRAAFVPVEFSAAAYRFGHSMVRNTYKLNEELEEKAIFTDPEENPGPLDDLRGFRPLPKNWRVNWNLFLEMGEDEKKEATSEPDRTLHSRRIDTRLATRLRKVPVGSTTENLALLDLERGWRLGLPSGEAVAKAMGSRQILDRQQLDLPKSFARGEAPLWYYILKEAELLHDGERLGETGGRLIAEVLVGLLVHDSTSFLNLEPRWRPSLGRHGRFGLADLFRTAESYKTDWSFLL
jgi:hypothetical protein